MSSANLLVFARIRFRHNELGLLAVIVVVVAFTATVDSNHNYWNEPWSSTVDLARQTSLLGIFSLGAAVVIISGGIDLSSGSLIAFSGTLCASLMVLMAPDRMQNALPLGLPVIALAIVATLLVGILVGSLHAWLITAVGLPPFIATLATLVGLRSLGRAICESVTESMLGGKSTQIQIYDSQFRYLATSVWIPAVIFLVLLLLIWVLLTRTVSGRHMYALGGNEQAARLSGIRTDRVKWLAYCIAALTSTIAGILYIGDQSVAEPQTLGRGYELNAIAAAVVGGCSLQGGVGTASGAALGALFLRVVIDGIAKIIKTGADVYEGLVVGLVVVVAVAVSHFRQETGTSNLIFTGALGAFGLVALTLLIGTIAVVITGSSSGFISGAIVLALVVVVKLWQSRAILKR